ncbi:MULTISPECIES: hypothetical protein [Enterobacteriaceae]|uniref:hypothetical protein n=1 Tax=Enterobacteriaceae TaxID=543 RepID=UPI001EF672FA|nr:hypothetical protein [Escherichia coli]EIA0034255.1 hypothetical protein [Salmonella enterica]CAB5619654.1 Uncharacterised protein [Escherichia coli]CAC9205051.1 Uncharacterised protein [Escherichia coli]
MKDFAMARHGLVRRNHEKTSIRQIAVFCGQAFCVIFTLLYFLVQLYEHAKFVA